MNRLISNFKFQISNWSAFTLLEMLVVVGMIAILVGLGAVSYSTAQKKSRDLKRKTDVKAIQNAFEQYYTICGFKYPTSLGSSIYCTSPTIGIMPTVPVDPKSGTSYTCGSCSSSSYTICANNLEAEPVGSPTGYCLQNQQ